MKKVKICKCSIFKNKLHLDFYFRKHEGLFYWNGLKYCKSDELNQISIPIKFKKKYVKE